MTRLRILSLFVALIALASAFAACGGGGSSDDPQTIVNEATLQGVESGSMDLSVDADITGKKAGHVHVGVSGAFQNESGAEVPELDLEAAAKGSVGGKKVDFQAGLTLLSGRAWVAYEGTEYEVDPTTYSFVKSLVKRRGAGQKGSGEATACQEAVSGLKVADLIENLRDEGSADVGGTSTTKIGGDLDAHGTVEALSELLEDPVCREELKATGQAPSQAELDRAKNTIEDSLKSARVELYVGDDHIIRRLTVKGTIEPPKGSEGGAEKVALDVDLTLNGVNEGQTISAPNSAKPLSDLFLKLGINPIELLGELQGGGGQAGIGRLLERLNQ